jgi:release factor glutamine methyltransferase
VPSTRALLAVAVERLRTAGVPTPEVDAELLLAHVTDRPRAMLRLAGDEVTDAQAEAFAALVARRATREPLQHCTGRAPFRHLELRVGPGVFVPRPETELVVDLVLAHLAVSASAAAAAAAPAAAGVPQASARRLVLVDLCTGSGALALALATEVPGAAVHAVEVSPHALAWARRNVAEHLRAVQAVGGAIALHAGDATTCAQPGGPLAELAGGADVVVTNPPYVPDDAVPREPEVRDHDPHLALFGGPDGLAVIRPLARQAARLLRPGGLLLVEHADVQGEQAGARGLPALLRSQADPAAPGTPAWRDVVDHHDLAGRPRITAALRR